MSYCSRCEKEVEEEELKGSRKNLCPKCGLIVRKHKLGKLGTKSVKTTSKILKEYPDTNSSKQINFNGKTLAIIEKLEQNGHGSDRDETIKKALEFYSQNLSSPNLVKDPIDKKKEELMMVKINKEIKEVKGNHDGEDEPSGASKIIKQLQDAEMSKEILDIYRKDKKGEKLTEDEFDKLEKTMAKQVRMQQMQKLLSNDGNDFGFDKMMKYQMFRNMMGPQQNNQSNTQIDALAQELKAMRQEQAHQQQIQSLEQRYQTQIQGMQQNQGNPVLEVMQESNKQRETMMLQQNSEKEKMQMQLDQQQRQAMQQEYEARQKELMQRIESLRAEGGGEGFKGKVQKLRDEFEALREAKDLMGEDKGKSTGEYVGEALIKNAPQIMNTVTQAIQTKKDQQEIEKQKLIQQTQALQQQQTQQGETELGSEGQPSGQPSQPVTPNQTKTPGLSQSESNLSSTMSDIYIKKPEKKPKPDRV